MRSLPLHHLWRVVWSWWSIVIWSIIMMINCYMIYGKLQVLLWRLLFLFHHLDHHRSWGHDAQYIWWGWKWALCFCLFQISSLVLNFIEKESCERPSLIQKSLYPDKGFYMLISTFYILAGLAFTSTIIEIIRYIWNCHPYGILSDCKILSTQCVNISIL